MGTRRIVLHRLTLHQNLNRLVDADAHPLVWLPRQIMHNVLLAVVIMRGGDGACCTASRRPPKPSQVTLSRRDRHSTGAIIRMVSQPAATIICTFLDTAAHNPRRNPGEKLLESWCARADNSDVELDGGPGTRYGASPREIFAPHCDADHVEADYADAGDKGAHGEDQYEAEFLAERETQLPDYGHGEEEEDEIRCEVVCA